MIHLVTYGDNQGIVRVLRFTDPARAYVALHGQCDRGELSQTEALWAMRQLAEVCREIYASESMAAAAAVPPGGAVKSADTRDDKSRGGMRERGEARPLPPLNTGAGDAAKSQPAATSQDTPPPSLYSWFLWLIGVA